MHILFLTDNFPPEGNAPASRTYEHVVRWVDHGHKVTVITCAPNFPEGKVYPGFKNSWYARSKMEGVDVIRVKTYITSNEGFVKRIVDYLSFMITGAIAALFQRKVDVIVGTSPQFFTAVAASLVSALKRKPFVFELRDIWPASITAVGAMNDSLVIRLLEKLELFLYRRADAIVTVTSAFRTELVQRGVEESKISVVLNGADTNLYFPAERKDSVIEAAFDLTGKFVVGYIGTHGLAHGLENVLEAASLLKKRKDVVFLFVGGGASSESLVIEAKDKNLENVVFAGRQPKELMSRVWSVCDVALVHLKDKPLFATVIPSKVFESMAMGIPILIAVPKGEATTVVERVGCGISVAPENPSELAAAVIQLQDPELRSEIIESSKTGVEDYSREKFANDMLGILESVANS